MFLQLSVGYDRLSWDAFLVGPGPEWVLGPSRPRAHADPGLSRRRALARPCCSVGDNKQLKMGAPSAHLAREWSPAPISELATAEFG